MSPVTTERMRKCLSLLRQVPLSELELAASEANWHENYEAEDILRDEIANRYRLWSEGYVAFAPVVGYALSA